ncbi:aminotransferase class IV [Desulfallas thermosapovorans]|uniref:Branched-chain amino acid aminotransferase n=1 Tax=Desulfallas thermosapovorans DSM 6562 TaxID=1121431 RepID=A0A5S4ZY89_9FIRM|nr:aminotransferase class IV [Desulfallas thermosapovorans]TYO97992.1 branched-chain amino acid aminotransferase [Desulfallas thermosapovorans DSM 6562]
MSEFYLVNGQIATGTGMKPGLKDMALLYGYSLFETMLVVRGRPVFINRHLKRMLQSVSELGIKLTYSYDVLAAMCSRALARSGIREGVLRLMVTAGDGGDEGGSVITAVREGLPYPEEQYAKGFALVTLDFPRNEQSPLVKHKTANYLENLLGRRKARLQGYDEGLFLNTRGMVAEGTVSNIFIVQDGILLTPPVEAGLLPGTVRRLVMEYAPRFGYRCMETDLSPGDIKNAGECFLTNALMGVMPVVSLDGHALGGGESARPGAVTKIIRDMYLELVLKELGRPVTSQGVTE